MLVPAGFVGRVGKQGGGGYSFADSDAAAVSAAMTTPPTSNVAAAIDYTVIQLKSNSLWTKFDWISPLPLHTQQAMFLNWKNPAQSMTAVNSPTYTAYTGVNGDGAASYVDTNYNPSSYSGRVYAQNSASVFIWSGTSAQQANAVAGYYDGTDGVTINPRDTSNRYVMRINQQFSVTGSGSTDGTGLYTISRTGATTIVMYKNGTAVASGSNASTAVNNNNLWLGRQTSSVYESGVVGGFGAGSGLTAGEVSTLSTIISTARTMMGAL